MRRRTALCVTITLTIATALFSGCGRKRLISPAAQGMFTAGDYVENRGIYQHMSADQTVLWESEDGQAVKIGWVENNADGQEVFRKLWSDQEGKIKYSIEMKLPFSPNDKAIELEVNDHIKTGSAFPKEDFLYVRHITAKDEATGRRTIVIDLVDSHETIMNPQEERAQAEQALLDSWIAKIKNHEIR